MQDYVQILVILHKVEEYIILVICLPPACFLKATICVRVWVLLDTLGRCKIHNRGGVNIAGKISDCLGKPNTFDCKENIHGYISIFGREVKDYFKMMNKIFKQYFLPLYVDMCYNKCLCSDIGVKCQRDIKGNVSNINEWYIMYTFMKSEIENFFAAYNKVERF